MRLAREVRAIRAESRRHRPRPPARGLVLEVGGGQSPHPRADVVVDKYVVDSFERAAETPLDLSKPLVVADGHRLPLADSSFDYAVAQHVLEHATDPEAFAGELSRVAGAGFVQVPSRLSELTFGWPYHPWLIDLDGGELVFAPKEAMGAPCGDEFHAAFAASPLMRLWWGAHRSAWHHSVEWRGELRVRVDGASIAERTASFDIEATAAALAASAGGEGLPPLPARVRDALRCPACRGELRWFADVTACAGCGRDYPVVGPVPLLLEEVAGAAVRAAA